MTTVLMLLLFAVSVLSQLMLFAFGSYWNEKGDSMFVLVSVFICSVIIFMSSTLFGYTIGVMQ